MELEGIEDNTRECGIEHPSDGEPCVLNLDHPGKWHMDGNDREWYGQPSGTAWDN